MDRVSSSEIRLPQAQGTNTHNLQTCATKVEAWNSRAAQLADNVNTSIHPVQYFLHLQHHAKYIDPNIRNLSSILKHISALLKVQASSPLFQLLPRDCEII